MINQGGVIGGANVKQIVRLLLTHHIVATGVGELFMFLQKAYNLNYE